MARTPKIAITILWAGLTLSTGLACGASSPAKSDSVVVRTYSEQEVTNAFENAGIYLYRSGTAPGMETMEEQSFSIGPRSWTVLVLRFRNIAETSRFFHIQRSGWRADGLPATRINNIIVIIGRATAADPLPSKKLPVSVRNALDRLREAP